MKSGVFFRTLLIFLFGVGLLATVISAYDSDTTLTETIVETLTPTTQREPKTILIVGDMMLGRQVGSYMRANGNGYPFARIKELLASVDMVAGNLEGPITTLDTDSTNMMRFHFDPSFAETLGAHNIALVSTANNHSLDQGGDGFADTRKYLTEAGIPYLGNLGTTETGAVVKIPGIKTAFIGLDTTITSHDLEKLGKELRSIPQTTHLMAILHWGDEYQTTHNAEQESFAHFLIDNGVDGIFGAHPHVVQDIEIYKEKPIFYSLGNFIFDQYWNKEVETGLAVKMTVGDEVSYELVPLRSERSQPYVMDESEKALFLDERGFSGSIVRAEP